MPNEHSSRPASAAHKWMHCAASPRLESAFSEEVSESAAEGTLAHSLAEITLGHYYKRISEEEFNSEFKGIRANALYKPEMIGYVNKHVDYVLEKHAELGGEIHFEKRLDYSRWVDNGWGTGDVVIASEGHLAVIDLKYGIGVKVDAYKNPQLMLYALGLLNEYEMAYSLDKVTVCIMQPRLDHISEYTLSVSELLTWGETVVKPAAEASYKEDAVCTPGEWCTKGFCKARHLCRARAEKMKDIAKTRFKDMDLLEPDEIAEILNDTPEIAKWCKDIENHALTQALAGHKYPGWKVVEGRSVRKISDEAGLVKALRSEGFNEAILYKRTLLSLTELEGIVGKSEFAKVSKDFIIKPQGKPVLVPESDKRKEFNKIEKATKAFSEEE